MSLIEVVIALGLTLLIAGETAKLAAGAGLRLRERSERMAAEHGTRVSAAALRSALESLGQDSASGADLAVMQAAHLVVRATRGAGVLCAVGPGLLVARSGPWWSALRAPVNGRDSILAASVDAPVWRVVALEGPPSAVLCPDGSSGLALPVVHDSLALAGIAAGSAVRIFEPVELRLYRSAADEWLGLRLPATSQPIQPLAGPLTLSGLELDYLRRDGSPALLPSEVAGIGFRLRGLTERAGGLGLVRGGAQQSDSLRGFVALRNAP